MTEELLDSKFCIKISFWNGFSRNLIPLLPTMTSENMPNVRHIDMWCSQVWREMNPQIIRKGWRMSKILLTDWSVDFAKDDESETSRMKEATNDLTNLISSLNLGSEEMLIEEYVQLAGETIVGVEYNMVDARE